MDPRSNDCKRGGTWYLYMLICGEDTLYTGITTDVDRRLREHRAGRGRGAKYTRGCHRLELVYSIEIGGRGLAARIEHRIKRLRKADKQIVVSRGFSRKDLLGFLGVSEGG